MKRREVFLMVVGLAMIAGGAGALQHLKANQRLGAPGIKSTPIEGGLRRTLEFPTNVPGYTAEVLPVDKTVGEGMPTDTSVAQMGYTDANGQRITTTGVMMGMDRTCIHKPQFCLRGQGWEIDESRSALATVHLERPQPVDLPVMKLISRQTVKIEGREVPMSSIYAYWFVAGDAVTADHLQRMWWMAENLVRKGELQRWAYISYFTTCAPGQEDAAFERIKTLMQATVPEFQLAWPEANVNNKGS